MFTLKLIKGSELAEGVALEQRLQPGMQRFSIGRDPGNHWPIPDRTLAISARHCEIIAAASGLVLRDLSTNGTFVNGSITRLQGDHRLLDGDRFELGPYVVAVIGPAADIDLVALDADAPHPTTMPGVKAAAPPPAPVAASLRGGDPAAVFASGSLPQRVGVTEILRAAPPADDSTVELTRIRLAPAKAGAPGPAPAPVAAPAAPTASAAALSPRPPPTPAPTPTPAPAPAPRPTPTPAPGIADAELLQTLARGLGLPAAGLQGRDAAATALQVATLARLAVLALRSLLQQQAASHRRLASRSEHMPPVPEPHALQRAATPEAALLALLAAEPDPEALAAAIDSARAELAAHPRRLASAFHGALSELAASYEDEDTG